MNNNQPRDYSALFNAFSADKPDKTGTILQRIGKISFTFSTVVGLIAVLMNKHISSSQANDLFLIWFAGWALGLLMFIATGTHYIGRDKGRASFISSSLYVLKKTSLYLFLPAVVITGIIIIWALITNQPLFQ